jgi:ADP-ribose pyrophosphatase
MVVKYRGEIFSVEEIAGMVNGRGVRFERIRENDVVVMLALVGGKLVMEKVKRLAVGKRLLELPAGHVEPREDIGAAAKREFEEETGYRAPSARHLFSAYMAPGLVDNMHHNFLLGGIRKGKTHRDPDEDMEIVLVPVNRALSMIRSNEIVDGKSIALILWAARNGII